MSTGLRRWLVSGLFGLVVGWLVGGLVPSLLGSFGTSTNDASGSDTPLVIGLLFSIAVAIAVTLSLARIPDERRRLGGGCLLLGGAVLLAGPGQVVIAGIASLLGSAGSGGTGALLFVLLLSLPYALVGAALIVAGVMLRKNRALPAPGGTRTE